MASRSSLPGPGAVAIKELGGGKLVSSKTARAHAKVRLAETLKLDGAGKKLLAAGSVKVKLQVSYTPTGGKPSTVRRRAASSLSKIKDRSSAWGGPSHA